MWIFGFHPDKCSRNETDIYQTWSWKILCFHSKNCKNQMICAILLLQEATLIHVLCNGAMKSANVNEFVNIQWYILSNGISCRDQKSFLRDLLHPTLCTHFHTVVGPPIPLHPTPPHKNTFSTLSIRRAPSPPPPLPSPYMYTRIGKTLDVMLQICTHNHINIWGWTKSCKGPIVKVASHIKFLSQVSNTVHSSKL